MLMKGFYSFSVEVLLKHSANYEFAEFKKNFFRTLKHRGKYGFGPGDDEIRGMGSRTSGAKAAFLSYCNFSGTQH